MYIFKNWKLICEEKDKRIKELEKELSKRDCSKCTRRQFYQVGYEAGVRGD